MPRQPGRESRPLMDKARRKQSSHRRIKIVVFSRARRQQAAAGPSTQPGRTGAGAEGSPEGYRAAAPVQHGAGDAGQRRESAHARKMKMFLIWLLLLDARRHGQGRDGEGGPGAGGGADAQPAPEGSR